MGSDRRRLGLRITTLRVQLERDSTIVLSLFLLRVFFVMHHAPSIQQYKFSSSLQIIPSTEPNISRLQDKLLLTKSAQPSFDNCRTRLVVNSFFHNPFFYNITFGQNGFLLGDLTWLKRELDKVGVVFFEF